MKQKLHPNVEKVYDAMCDIDDFLVKLQDKWDSKTLMAGICWSLGKWIAECKDDKYLPILSDCMSEIVLQIERHRRYMKKIEQEKNQ